jgi:hypothetical protein
MLMTKWAGTGGVKNGSFRFSVHSPIVDPNRLPITVGLNGISLGDLAEWRHSHDGYVFSKDRRQICLDDAPR